MKVLVALDGSKSSEKALEKAVELGLIQNSSLILFHVIPSLDIKHVTAYEKLIEQEARQEAEKYLKRKKEELEDLCKSVEIKIVVGDPKEQILIWAEDFNVDMIIVGTKGLSGITRALLGSVAQYVVTYSKHPVLVVPSRD